MVAESSQPPEPARFPLAISAMIAKLERTYQFREPDEVRAFLAIHPEIGDLALTAAVKIAEYLPIQDQLVLEFFRDPEDDEDDGQLFALVPTRLPPMEVRSLMDQLLRDWLLEVIRPTGLLFNVGVEYR